MPLRRPVKIERLLEYPHIHATYPGTDIAVFDSLLAAKGLHREIVVNTGTPLTIPLIVRASPLVAVLPRFVTRLFKDWLDLYIVPLEMEGLEVPTHIVRHMRDRANPLLDYIEQTLIETSAAAAPSAQ